MNNQKTNTVTITKTQSTVKGGNYLALALFAFAGIGIEAVYAFLLEPLLYGADLRNWLPWQVLIHWTITCISWSAVVWLILRTAARKLDCHLLTEGSPIPLWRFAVVGILLAAVVVENLVVNGELKLVHEFKNFVARFQNIGALAFLFQHIYYLCETALFTLIIIFGQKACEKWFHNDKIPYGGIVTALTWGIGHFFSKDFITGIYTMVFGFGFGAAYLLLNRNVKWVFPVLFLIFII